MSPSRLLHILPTEFHDLSEGRAQRSGRQARTHHLRARLVAHSIVITADHLALHDVAFRLRGKNREREQAQQADENDAFHDSLLVASGS